MKKWIVFPLIAASLLTSCNRSGKQVWNDTKTAAKEIGKGFKTLWGGKDHPQQYAANDDFFSVVDEDYSVVDENEEGITVESIPQPQISPGDKNAPIPGIDSFVQPTGSLSSIFRNIHFDCASNKIFGSQNLSALKRIAEHLKSHKNTYMFIEGHCDERGAADYNLALGMRRANAVREYLVKMGVNPEHLFSTSYGWERPFKQGHNESVWKENRRTEFKLYTR